ncbi:hypothetical protein Xcel_1008 [Xylanimonas cellulosilytica DSM 15894]|uniref:DUF2993 domain-containing protein n=1 Tax=Xylanimonas cellulosilytica (strain DSM 15894 / JCM 12276 / CECT 5975 / KCTC 9989 / LMG 20990 / NBRC 107835 / XIL07) TaxID=446471 RepID=D1BYW4_XYLCX|nr:hypothetical protein [Xylanimonas cellulosilytica]ACZ30039.1 hypothetical protein Xcel_1008 [Xylanimonas cellulosilytica DSM 15894]
MLIRLTPAEAVALAAMGGAALPPVITSVTADDDTIRVTADLRRLDDLPGALKLAARLAPVVRADVRVLRFAAPTATLGVDVNASGLPARRLLGLLSAPIAAALRRKGLPPDAVTIESDGVVVADVAALLVPVLPGLDVTRLAVEKGELVVEASA